MRLPLISCRRRLNVKWISLYIRPFDRLLNSLDVSAIWSKDLGDVSRSYGIISPECDHLQAAEILTMPKITSRMSMPKGHILPTINSRSK